jgi:beta-lactamase class A
VWVLVLSLGATPTAYATTDKAVLKRELSRYLKTRSGKTTIAVYDIADDTAVFYNPGIAEYTASIVKVNILMAVMAKAQAAHKQLSNSQKQLAVKMIEYSDNNAATSLWNSAGGSIGITAFNRRDGIMSHTTMNRNGYWGLTTTTAADQAEMMHRLATSDRMLTQASRAYILSLMSHVTSSEDWGVSYGVRAKASVALKNGWLPVHGDYNNWQINSIGRIEHSGYTYTIAVLSGGNPSKKYGIQTVERISALVWKYL